MTDVTVHPYDECLLCHQPVEWAYTVNGRLAALDAEHSDLGNIYLEANGTIHIVGQGAGGRRTLHADTCPLKRRPR